MMKELLDLAAKWDQLSGQRLTEANRLGPGKAGEVRATEAGILKDCSAELRQILATAQAHRSQRDRVCISCDQPEGKPHLDTCVTRTGTLREVESP